MKLGILDQQNLIDTGDIVQFVPNHKSHMVALASDCNSEVSASLYNPKVPSSSPGPIFFFLSDI